ncbi:matrilysin [Phoca vitulina]|uniref:matrilysin n=1 Tax=Phoca vitulina TaxID=9720 RepID=UPI001396577D|nr:matrilysin [Phoca vitulina]
MRAAALLCALCLLPLPRAPAGPLPPGAAGTRAPPWTRAQDYLKRFYPSDSETREADSFEAQLKLMQRFFRLPVTGVLNSRVIEIMQKPRCGVPDIAEYSLFPTQPKWISRVVTYRVVSYTKDLPRVTVNQLVAKALTMWSQEVPLSFRRVLVGTADIMISFARGAHGDSHPFDGPGNTLAHAFAPGPGLGGDAHFDEDERWTDGSRIGVNFLTTATHELGHSLGLGHSSDPDAVMYPTYRVRDSKNFKLSPDDIEGIQKLYGKKSKSRKN